MTNTKVKPVLVKGPLSIAESIIWSTPILVNENLPLYETPFWLEHLEQSRFSPAPGETCVQFIDGSRLIISVWRQPTQSGRDVPACELLAFNSKSTMLMS